MNCNIGTFSAVHYREQVQCKASNVTAARFGCVTALQWAATECNCVDNSGQRTSMMRAFAVAKSSFSTAEVRVV